MIPAVIYARYSSTNQREESIEGQLRECHRYAERVGLSVIHEYTDAAISGTSDKRPAFQQMIRDSKKKAFEIVIVWKLDRFARNRYDAAIYRKQLQDNGVRIVSAMETFSDGPEGIILEGLMEAMAEYYSANLAENIQRGMYDSALQRKFLGQPVLGYKKGKDGRYEIDPLTAPIVQRIFHDYAAGKSQPQIIKELNADGFRTIRDRKFTRNSLRSILANEKYIGMYRFKDISDPKGIPAIIEPDLFEKVQAMVGKRRYKKRTPEETPRYLLSTKLFCGHCEKMMTGESARSVTGAIFRYYSCTGVKSKPKTCNKSRVPSDWIEKEVIRILTTELMNDEFIEMIADGFVKMRKSNPAEQKIKDLNRQLKPIQKKIDNVNRAIAEGIWSESTASMLRELEEQKQKLSESIQEAQLSVSMDISRDEVIEILKDVRDAAIHSDNVAQALIDGFVFRIYLFDAPGNKHCHRLLMEYSPTGYIEDVVEYEEILEVRAKHSRLHFNAGTRTIWTYKGSVFVEYHLKEK